MSKLIFIWNIDHNKKVKIKEIREYNIVRENSDEKSEYCVDAFGFFHGAVRMFKGSKMECIDFVDSLTERTGNKEKLMTDD
jgi:hypothetical protein